MGNNAVEKGCNFQVYSGRCSLLQGEINDIKAKKNLVDLLNFNTECKPGVTPVEFCPDIMGTKVAISNRRLATSKISGVDK